MSGVDDIDPEIRRIFAAKEERRLRLAGLPFPEKVDVVVQMQRMVEPILRARGIQVRAWEIGKQAADPA